MGETRKNHPAAGGSVEHYRKDISALSLLHIDTCANSEDEETLEETLERAARYFGFGPTMDAYKVCVWLRDNKKLTDHDIQEIERVIRYE
ncbi:hypothetical protein JQC72_06260 [Polycladomyces sp. WAk]|uniref:Uncharacterized protein n=1 Tax=Polycladomyces zharkentensis TaxID=2807616 RepID=A0ABS2WI47_9BACL|nr:hypothetical protein [Polycladomyces sp. WAk]MBN2909125.1 hypothetical protein [Polycladomyces sp. WAk]